MSSSSGLGGNPHLVAPESVDVGFQMLLSVLNGSNSVMAEGPGEDVAVGSGTPGDASSISAGDGDGTPGDAAPPGLPADVGGIQIEDTELQVDDGPIIGGGAADEAASVHSPAVLLDGVVPTACHGSGAGGVGSPPTPPTAAVLLASQRLSCGTTGMSKPGHCSPVNVATFQVVSSPQVLRRTSSTLHVCVWQTTQARVKFVEAK